MPIGDSAPAARFEFATVARILFGVGVSDQLPGLAAAFGRRVFVVVGAHPQRHSGLLSGLASAVESVACFAVAAEPTVALADEGAIAVRAARSEVVVALGGGSVLDTAKAVAALATNEGSVLDYLEVVGRGRTLSQPSLPVIALPTTAGTGAEVTRNAVLGVPAARIKASLRSPHLLPRIALVDPLLAVNLPAGSTATTGMDALTQLIESFVSCRANPLTDAFCRDGIPRVARALPIAVREPARQEARADLALGALESGLALANAGLGAVHGFAAPIGGLFAAPHGAVCAALLPHVLRANLAALRQRAPRARLLERFDEIARWLTGRANARADDAVAACAELTAVFAIPPLTTWGLSAAAIPDLVAKAAAASSMKGNPLPLTPAELTGIMEVALGG